MTARFSLLYQLRAAENKSLEPSALAGMAGAVKFVQTEAGNRYIKERGLEMKMPCTLCGAPAEAWFPRRKWKSTAGSVPHL